MTDSDLEEYLETQPQDESQLHSDPIDRTFIETDKALAELIAELREELVLPTQQRVQPDTSHSDSTNTMSGAATMFGSTEPLSEEDVRSLMTKHKKENRKSLSEKELSRVLEAATAPLGQQLVVQSSLGTCQVTGEESTDLNTTEIATLYVYSTVTKEMMCC